MTLALRNSISTALFNESYSISKLSENLIDDD